jgi:predicted hydrolase (HD superfamily)
MDNCDRSNVEEIKRLEDRLMRLRIKREEAVELFQQHVPRPDLAACREFALGMIRKGKLLARDHDELLDNYNGLVHDYEDLYGRHQGARREIAALRQKVVGLEIALNNSASATAAGSPPSQVSTRMSSARE